MIIQLVRVKTASINHSSSEQVLFLIFNTCYFTKSFIIITEIHSVLQEYVLNTCSVSGTVLGTEGMLVNQREKSQPSWSLHSGEEDRK